MLTPGSKRIRETRKLTRRVAREKAGLFLAEGAQAVREAVAAGPGRTVEIFVTASARDRYEEIVNRAEAVGIVTSTADSKSLAGLSETVTPQGLVAVCRSLTVGLDRALAGGTAGGNVEAGGTAGDSVEPSGRAADSTESGGPAADRAELGAASGDDDLGPGGVASGAPRLIAVLVEARDPGNAGTVIRCADAAGADAVVLTHGSVDPQGGKAVRASAGSVFHLPIAVGSSVETVIEKIRDRGMTILAADGSGETDLDEARAAGLLSGPTAWFFGNEARGLPEPVRNLADQVVRVPIYGRAESLNLATAAAVCLYATARRV